MWDRARPERVRVTRVLIARKDEVHEIRGCWICIEPDAALVGIWSSPSERDPMITVPLEQVTIEWPALEMRM